MPLGTEIGLGTEVDVGPGDIVLDGEPALPKKAKGAQPLILGPCLYCGQPAECIKIQLGTEIGLSLGDIVLDGTQLPLP